MDEPVLSKAVEQFAQATQRVDQTGLERPWAWGDYDSEGVRFAFFRMYEELRELAVKIAAQRVAQGQAPSSAQRVLAQYHVAYCDLQAALLGLSADDLQRAPTPDEWPIRRIVEHIVGADVGFYVCTRYALDRHRAGDSQPGKIPNEAWDALIGMDEPAFDAIMQGPFAGLQQFHRQFHERVLDEFAGIQEQELALSSMYWESQPQPLRFRLHRFDSHMRQHTIQVDKALLDIGCAPTEARRLLRLIYGALGEAQSAAIGAQEIAAGLSQEVAYRITGRTAEIERIITN